MAILSCVTSTSMPYWDGGRILFEIIDGDAYVPCAISEWRWKRSARSAVSGKPICLRASLAHANASRSSHWPS